ncbi:MAG TPA: GAF domain-containing protein [Thermoplasmata archaeon]|nr:GAF domain-containing protein [Thermoplasmata archaeon]
MKGVGNFVGFAKRELTEEDRLLEEVKRLVNEKASPQALYDAAATALNRLPRHSWVGIYMAEGGDLVLKAWKGPQATQHVRIPMGEGVCGAAAKSGRTEVVPDVSKDPRYLQSFPSTRSEIVVPIKDGKQVYGEIDVDGDELDAFGERDKVFLEKLAFHLMLGVRGKV